VEYVSGNGSPKKEEIAAIDEEIPSEIDDEEDSRSIAETGGKKGKKYNSDGTLVYGSWPS
jgi:hypothetical protein